MIRFAFLILIIISLMTGSCSGRKNKLNKTNLIPEKEMVSILTDIHIADGLLTIPKIRARYPNIDSIETYIWIIEKHGYSKDAMDKTMHYYFINKPKKLNKIYDQVLEILSEMESRVEKESIIEQARVSNLWTGKDFYTSPSLSGNDSTVFDVKLYRSGIYTLTYSATLFPDDQSLNARAIAYLCSPDSLETGKRRYFKTAHYIKDGIPHIYTLTFSVPDKTILQLRGYLLDFDNCPLSFERHIQLENISLTYSSALL